MTDDSKNNEEENNSCVYTHNFNEAMTRYDCFYFLDKEDVFENIENAIAKNKRQRLGLTLIIEINKPQTLHRLSVDVFPLDYYDYIILNCSGLDTDTVYEYWKIMDSYKKNDFVKYLGVRNIRQNTLENLISLTKLHKLTKPSMYILDATIPATREKIIKYCLKNGLFIYLVNKLNMTNDNLKKLALEKKCNVKDLIASRIVKGGLGLLSYNCIDFNIIQLTDDDLIIIDDSLMEALF